MARVKRGNPAVAVGYLRVSTEEQHLGPDAQRAAIEVWAAREGVRIACWHTDKGVSGGSELDDREGLMAAIKDLRTHGAGVLAVAKRDRLARNVEVVIAIESSIRAAGAAVASADGQNGDDPGSVFMRRIDDARAEHERAIISQRTKAALNVKRRRGERIGECPYGFRAEQNGVLVPEPGEQRVMTVVYELRTQGLSERDITAELEARGLRSRAGTPFQRTQVHRLLVRATVLSCGRGHVHADLKAEGSYCLRDECGSDRGSFTPERRIEWRSRVTADA